VVAAFVERPFSDSGGGDILVTATKRRSAACALDAHSRDGASLADEGLKRTGTVEIGG
jgi:hypothetical protein